MTLDGERLGKPSSANVGQYQNGYGSQRRNIRSLISPNQSDSLQPPQDDFYSIDDNRTIFDMSNKIPNIMKKSADKKDFINDNYKPFASNPFGTSSRKSLLSETLDAEQSKMNMNIYSIDVENTDEPKP